MAGWASTAVTLLGTDDLRFEPDELTVPAGEEVTVELAAEAVEHDFVIEDVADIGEAGDAAHGDHGDDGDMEDMEDMDGDSGAAHAEDGNDLHVAHAGAGETVTNTFTIDEAGTYEFSCSVPGHREAGMVGTLEVVAEG